MFTKPDLRFITYNVWFEDFNFRERTEELCNIMQGSSADFICLQVIFPFQKKPLLIFILILLKKGSHKRVFISFNPEKMGLSRLLSINGESLLWLYCNDNV